jgi:hypothetical protein
MLNFATTGWVLICVAIHLPHRPQSIDVAVMHIEDWVEGRELRVAHLTYKIATKPYMQTIMHMLGKDGSINRQAYSAFHAF